MTNNGPALGSTSGGSSPQHLGGAWPHAMVSAVARAYNRGLGTESQRDPGAEPLVRGQSSPEGKTFGFWAFNESLKFVHFSKNCKHKNQIFVLTLHEITGGYETGGSGAKMGEACVCPQPQPKTATVEHCQFIDQCHLLGCRCRYCAEYYGGLAHISMPFTQFPFTCRFLKKKTGLCNTH